MDDYCNRGVVGILKREYVEEEEKNVVIVT